MWFKKKPAWFKIGSVLLVLNVGLHIIVIMGMAWSSSDISGLGFLELLIIPSSVTRYIGVDLLGALINNIVYTSDSSFFNLLIGNFLFIIGFGYLIGILFDKKIVFKKKLYLIIFMIIVFFSTGYYSYLAKKNDKKIISENFFYGERTDPDDRSSRKIFILDPNICKKISILHSNTKKDCFEAVVIPQDSRIQGCFKENKDKFAFFENRDKCLTEVAIERGDYSICNLHDVSSDKQNCLKILAVEKVDINGCTDPNDPIYDSDIYGKCVSEIVAVNNDITLCEKIDHYYSYYFQCLEQIISQANDPQECAKINDGSNSGIRYYNICLKNVAVSINDPAVCDLIIKGDRYDVGLRNKCLNEILL